MRNVTIKILFLLAAAPSGGLFTVSVANQAAPVLPSPINPAKTQPGVRSNQDIKDLAYNQTKAFLEKVIADIDSSTPQVRKAAMEALVQRGDPLAIARLIQDPDSELASQACWAIGELRDPKTSPQAVLGLQQHASPLVRGNCALAVGRIDAPEGASALNAAALNEKEDVQVRLAAIQALAMTDSESAPSLSSLLGNADVRIRASAAYSACQLQLPSAVEGVKAMLASADPETKGFGLQAAGLWPEEFAEDLAKIAADPDGTLENRLLGLTAMEALPKEQKEAVYAKSLLPLVKPDQPADIQVAAAQILYEVPAARPELQRIAKDGRRAPELLDKLSEIGFQTAAPVSPVTYPNAAQPRIVPAGVEALLGAVVGAALVFLGAFLLAWFQQKAEPKGEPEVDRLRKEILLEMLTDDRFKQMRPGVPVEMLVQVIGADEETTKRLLVEIGARGSEEAKGFWVLRKKSTS
jgi:hypothetical protein